MDTITIPADLAELEYDALGEMLDAVTKQFDALVEEGSRDVPTMTALADDVDRLRDEIAGRDAAAEQADATVAALTDRVRGGSAEPEAEAEAEADATAEVDVTAEVDATAEVEPEAELIAASAVPVKNLPKRPALGDVAANATAPKVDAQPKATVSILAAADLPGVKHGANIDLLQVAESMHDRARDLTNGQKASVARIETQTEHMLGTDPMLNAQIIDEVIGQPEAAALVASGGWCAPSIPIFELFDIGPDLDNLFDLPKLSTKVRAGVMIPSFYGIGDATDAFWTWTEADDIAALGNTGDPLTDKTKPCMRIPCPEFTECVPEAEGLCVTHGNLADRAWPELTKHFLSIVMRAHQRRMSAVKIAKVLGDTDVVTPGAAMAVSDAAGDLLNVISLAAADLRSQYRVSKRRAVDALLPDWTLEVLRANMAMRAGVWDAMNISDAQITSWLTARGVRPQFTPDWQPLYNGDAASTAWPAELTFSIWISGSYISIDLASIDLGVQRDSTLNATNDFTAAWSEEFFQVCRRGPKGRSYTVPLGIDGVTAAV